MSDPPVRIGPPVPRGMAGEKAPADPGTHVLPGPVLSSPESRREGRQVPERAPARLTRKEAQASGGLGDIRLQANRASSTPVARWPGIDMGRLLSGILVAILVVATIWIGWDAHEPVAGFGIVGPDGALISTNGNGLEAGDALPPFRLLSTTDDVVELADFEGRPLVIHLWNTWCLDCIADLPVIQQAADQWDGQVAVVGIAPDEPVDRVAKAADRHGASYTMLLDADEAVATQYGATTVPVTIVVDATGTVVAIHQGPIAFQDIERALAPLLP